MSMLNKILCLITDFSFVPISISKMELALLYLYNLLYFDMAMQFAFWMRTIILNDIVSRAIKRAVIFKKQLICVFISHCFTQ
jgi:hypothetical protein